MDMLKSDKEINKLDKAVKPIQLVLNKVSKADESIKFLGIEKEIQLQKATYTIKRSTTIILPEWYTILKQLAQAVKEQKPNLFQVA